VRLLPVAPIVLRNVAYLNLSLCDLVKWAAWLFSDFSVW
jgi:hypothetical protein